MPGLAILAFQAYSWYLDGTQADFDLFFFAFGIVSFYLVFLAVTGKQPRFMDKQA